MQSQDDPIEAWRRKLLLDPAAQIISQEQEDVRSRARRRELAISIKERLPGFLRDRRPSELLSSIKSEAFCKAAREWQPGGGNLLLLGETDTGKSTAAGYICRRIIAAGVADGGAMWDIAQGIYWAHAARMEKVIQATPFGRTCRELAAASDARLLVIDDAGWERDPKWLATLMADHYEESSSWRGRGRNVILTSGLTFAELRGPEGDAHGTRFPGYGAAVMRRFTTTEKKLALIIHSFPQRDAQKAAP